MYICYSFCCEPSKAFLGAHSIYLCSQEWNCFLNWLTVSVRLTIEIRGFGCWPFSGNWVLFRICGICDTPWPYMLTWRWCMCQECAACLLERRPLELAWGLCPSTLVLPIWLHQKLRPGPPWPVGKEAVIKLRTPQVHQVSLGWGEAWSPESQIAQRDWTA